MSLLNQLIHVPRFNLVLCELHYTPIHGKTKQSCPTIEGHYLLIDKFDGSSGIMLDDYEEYTEYDTDHEISDTESDIDDEEDNVTHIYQIQQQTVQHYMDEFDLPHRQKPHKLIRNYHNIIRSANYIKPEIAECFNLPTGEYIAIIKTMWIKFIQRKWKKVFAARQHIIKCRSCPSSLSTRQLTGYWPQHCLRMPGLKGMLSNII
jgi:hypothetical protein